VNGPRPPRTSIEYPQDYAQALKWYRLAAAQGHAKAQYNLGAMYGKGQGVPQNYVQALKWLTLAAATFTTEPEHGQAVQSRDIVAATMTPAQIAEAQKLAREWQKQYESSRDTCKIGHEASDRKL
jgi:uncharacterized protein